MPISTKISRNSAFSGSDKHRMLFFLLINVKMPTFELNSLSTRLPGQKFRSDAEDALKQVTDLCCIGGSL